MEDKDKPDRGAIIGALVFGTLLTGFAFAFIGPKAGVVMLIISVFFLYTGLTTSKKEIEEIQKRNAEQEAKKWARQQSLNIKCPTCQSSNVERITASKKAAYIIGLGIFAPAFKKVRSQFECKRCGYKW